jgi:hypothetical protein
MNTLQRRRQFFGKGVAYITFHGAGGQTATGDVTVIIPVLKGTVWMHVVKPEFMIPGTAKQQNGFTSVQGDDNTLIESGYAVSGDMTVYASYTVIETGVITHKGEILSPQRWIDKYADSVGVIDQYGVHRIIDGMQENLIEFFYFKDDDRAYALMSTYFDGKDLRLGVSVDALWQYNVDIIAAGANIPHYRRSPVSQPVTDEIMSISDGVRITDEIYNAAIASGGSDCIEHIRSWQSAGSIIPQGGFYLMSPAEVVILCRNIQKLTDFTNLAHSYYISKGVLASPVYTYQMEAGSLNGANSGFNSYTASLYAKSPYFCRMMVPISLTAYSDAYIRLALWDFSDISNPTVRTDGSGYAITDSTASSYYSQFVCADVSHLFADV